jgi:aminopeptidase
MLYNSVFHKISTPEQLARYADVLVHAGLGKGTGIKAGDVVLVRYTPESTVLVPYIQASITTAGGHMLQEPIIRFLPHHSTTLAIANNGTQEQVNFFPLEAKKSLYTLADHYLKLKSPVHNKPDQNFNNPMYVKRDIIERQTHELERYSKEHHWQSYTLAYIPTEALAEQSDVSIEAIWNQIVNTCFLNEENSVEKMRDTIARVNEMEEALNALEIRSVSLVGEKVDLTLELTPEARFRCSRGGNVPSFECFVTPHAEKTNGWITFSYPLLYEGHRIENLHVEFTNGKVTDWSTTSGADAFASMLELKGMKQLGELALTDKRLSMISEVIPGSPLFLENIGGTAHVAFGKGYEKCFADKTNTHFCNESVDHRDVVLGGDFTAIATTRSGKQVVIFANGECPLI